GALHELGELADDPAGVGGLMGAPAPAALLEHVLVDQEIEGSAGDVDHDAITVLDERDGAAVDRLGGDVADAEAPGAAAEAAVGDEGAFLSPTGALERTGDGEHLAHARTALRTLVDDGDRI